jgi:hypothetical protein
MLIHNKLKTNSASCWSYYTDVLRCTVSKTLSTQISASCQICRYVYLGVTRFCMPSHNICCHMEFISNTMSMSVFMLTACAVMNSALSFYQCYVLLLIHLDMLWNLSDTRWRSDTENAIHYYDWIPSGYVHSL